RQDELAYRFAEESLIRRHSRGAKARRFGIGIGIKRGKIDRAAPGPEASAAHFVRVGFACHFIGQMRHAARMTRRAPAGKARHGEIEAAPEKMHRARLAKEAGPKLFEHPIGVRQYLEKAADCI